MVQERPVRVERRLSAILAADVAGYSRLMHHDEEATHAKLTALLADGVTPAISEHGGRIVKNTGDGLLAEFPSAVEAVRAAVQFQTRVKELTTAEAEDRRIAFRVGINVGDVIVEPHDIFGDGVNIAARLESIAEPGGICISSAAYDQIRGKVGIEFVDLGEQSLKNIALPIRAYAVVRDGAAPATQAERTSDEYGVIITQLIDYAGYHGNQISAIAVSCVVPPMLTTTQELAQKFFKLEPLIVGPGIKTGMPILYESPKDVGADRIVNGIAAYEKYRDSCIIVDFGTATTIDLISKKGEYVGGAIAPGLSISLEALVQRASKLPRIEIVKPKEVVGRNTVNSIQAGIFFGYVGLVDGIVRRIQKEQNVHAKVVATGGLAPLVAAECSSISQPPPSSV